ncbi:hypothetical protein [Sphingomonas trueperi]|uniref:Uncharacterized protein n=1 Tax=Sphingomonas trueperi TaxID=53317 RepID=A0A7X6BE80_9SPHN|nr:hypothetical protein [Sphingomonas trueperi]NJB99904.1 hypothetical protein [Sphingomonas trueperi]
MFFPTIGGEWIPIKDVKSILVSNDPSKNARVETADEVYEVDGHAAKLMRSLPVSAFPAAAGTYVLTMVSEGDEKPTEVFPAMVIAWGLDAEGISHPITASGVDDGNNGYHAIRMPDDTVVQPLGNEWPTFREYLAKMEVKLVQAPPELMAKSGQAAFFA